MANIDPVFNLRFLENMKVVLYNEGYQMIELFILLQLIQVLVPGSNLTSILKVLLKQYKSPTGPNKFSRGITPTKADQTGPNDT